jgi:hypothetical protein
MMRIQSAGRHGVSPWIGQLCQLRWTLNTGWDKHSVTSAKLLTQCQADRVIEFVAPTSETAKEIDKQYWVVREVGRPKYRPKHVVAMMTQERHTGFNYYYHTQLWKAEDGKNTGKGFGVMVSPTSTGTSSG